MNPYYPLLNKVFYHQPCTRFHLELIENGRYKEQIDECTSLKYIVVCQKNENGDDLYCLTDLGKKIVDNPTEGQ